jgi:hypothetical protein
MTGIIVTVVSFVAAVLGLVHSHAAPEGQKGILGLSRLGATLVLLSIVGVAAGVFSQVSASKAAGEDKKWREETTALLRNVNAQLGLTHW